VESIVFFALRVLSQASAAPVDEWASKPAWACSYGVEDTTCGGPDVFGGFEVQHTVQLCGEAQQLCERTWRLSGPLDDLLMAMPAWAGEIETQVGSSGWRVALAPTPQAWLAKRWSETEIASVEVGEDYLIARILPRETCDAKTVIADLDVLVLPLAEAGISEVWPEIAATQLDHLDERVARRIRERSLDPVAGTALQRRTLLSADAFQCYLEISNRRERMEGLRELFVEWAQWRNPDPKEIRARNKAERVAAKEEAQRAKRDVARTDIDEVPDEKTPEEKDPDDWID
jgi:hypothetical protein